MLGTTALIEAIIREAEEQAERKIKKVSLETLISRISKDMGTSRESMTGGGWNRKVTRARAMLAYAWVRYLGRSGHELAKVLGVSPQAIYAASDNIEDTDVISSEDIERWCK